MDVETLPEVADLIASSARLPTDRAYGVATDSLRRSLLTLGHGVLVAAPVLGGTGGPPVDINLTSPSWIWSRKLQEYSAAASFGTWSARLAVARKLRSRLPAIAPERLWTRFPELALASRESMAKIVLELHHVPHGFERYLTQTAARLLARRLVLVAISDRIADSLGPIAAWCKQVLVEPSGVDTKFFLPHRSLSSDPLRLLYIGSFSSEGEERGCRQFVDLASALQQRKVNSRLRIVGGRGHEVSSLVAYRDGLGISPVHCSIEPHVPRGQVSSVVEWADIVLANYPERLTARHESPLKLIEYAASGRPIVASATSSVLGTLPARAFIPYAEGDLESLIDAVLCVATSATVREGATSSATSWAQQREWSARTGRILDAITQ